MDSTSSPLVARARRWAPGCLIVFVLMVIEVVVMAVWMLDSGAG